MLLKQLFILLQGTADCGGSVCVFWLPGILLHISKQDFDNL